MRSIPVCLAVVIAVLLAGCASAPTLRVNAAPAPVTTTGAATTVPVVEPEAAAPMEHTDLHSGTGTLIDAAAARPRSLRIEAKGEVVFNFENQPVDAVVKAILGDLLKQNYAIAPGVQGAVTFATAEPVRRADALPILEMLLSWTNNALVERDGSYLVLPTKDAIAGNVVPSLGAAVPARGFQARLFPLHYIAAQEMQKLLKPFARPDAFLLVDNARNLLVLAGTPDDLANYARTIHIFDVDWLKGMSVGVYALQRADVKSLLPELDKLFGPKGDTPLAGMLRFIPLERTNSIVVITPQPAYLEEVRDWIARMDRGGGNSDQLYVYDVRNVQASYLADYLNQIYNGAAPAPRENHGRVAPTLAPTTLQGGMSSGAAGGSSPTQSYMQMPGQRAARPSAPQVSAGSQNGENGVRITAVDENNQLLVRCRPGQWSEILAAIKRLDLVPLQVQIEARILEVQLTGAFQFGVQWYLQGLTGSQPGSPPGYAQPNNPRQGAMGLGGVAYNPSNALFYSFINSRVQVALQGLETSGNTRVLSAPSVVVMNNQEATIQVGDQVPVNQTYFVPGISGGGTSSQLTLGSVQYISTGVILDVTPRVNPGGLVYLDITQQVSTPGNKDQYGNYTISQRALTTQVAVQSGHTVLLGGLIQQNSSNTDSGVPFLNRIPLLGRLFGTTQRSNNRTELIVLITPRVIANSQQAEQITDEYQRQFQSLQPLKAAGKGKAGGGKPH